MAAVLILPAAARQQAALAAPSAVRQPPRRSCSRTHSSRSLHESSTELRKVGRQWHLEVQRGFVPDASAVSKLLALSFIDPADDDEGGGAAHLSGPQLMQYQLKLLAALQWRASTLGKKFVTITATERSSGELAGVANLTPGLSVADAADHLKLGSGEAACTVFNMAVAAAYRRRGLGRLLLAACERAAVECYSPPTTLMALAVYRQNEAAVTLYSSSGYCLDDTWLDQRWAESAEKGRVGFARRQLMLKPLGPASQHRCNGGGGGSGSNASSSNASSTSSSCTRSGGSNGGAPR